MNVALLVLALTSLALSISGCAKANLPLAVSGQIGGVLVLFLILLKLKMQC